jgi:heat shock protein HtpX
VPRAPQQDEDIMANQIKTALLLGALSALLIGVGSAVAPQYLYTFVLLALAFNAFSYFFSDRLVLRLHGAREISLDEGPQIHALVQELADRAAIPKPRVYLIPAEYANAFATGRNPRQGVVAVSAGLLHLLSTDELRGVVAHEIAHIKNRDILIATIAAVLAAVVTYVAHLLQFSTLFGGGGTQDDEHGGWAGGLLMALVAPLAAMLIQLGISRSREYVADETGARLARDPAALASALERLARKAIAAPANVQPATASLFIVNPLAGETGLVHLFSTHPPMQERVRRLRMMPTSGRFAA